MIWMRILESRFWRFAFYLAVVFGVSSIAAVAPQPQIDSTLINGLITATSIVFGFMTAVVASERKQQYSADVFVLLALGLFLLWLAGVMVFFSALFSLERRFALMFVMMSFSGNMFTSLYFLLLQRLIR